MLLDFFHLVFELLWGDLTTNGQRKLREALE